MKWDPQTLATIDKKKQCGGSTGLIFGVAGSGKTLLMLDIVNATSDRYTDVYVFSLTVDSQGDVYNFVKKENRFNCFDTAKLTEIINKQKKWKNDFLAGKKVKDSYPLIILDDIICDPQVRKSPLLKEIFINHRHLCIQVLALSQEIGGRDGLPKPVRSNCNFIACFFIFSEYDRKLISSQYLAGTDKSLAYEHCKNIWAEPHTAVVIDLKLAPIVHEDDKFVFSYKSSGNVPDIKIGKKNIALDNKEHGSSLIKFEPYRG